MRKEARKGSKIEVNNLHKSQPTYCVYVSSESNNFFMFEGRKREH